MRHPLGSFCRAILTRLPPAIRPGLHCGLPLAAVNLHSDEGLPPAIRPGLHCGVLLRVLLRGHGLSSPGHQAGAPLRHRLGRRGWRGELRLPPAIRPGLHCGGWAARAHHARYFHFPRPSGRGSIAAVPGIGQCGQLITLPPAIRPGLHCGRTGARPGIMAAARLPPAIRPGLHCGTACAPACGTSPLPSPGHQAGAPLRRASRRIRS